jgi:hypothetical protein
MIDSEVQWSELEAVPPDGSVRILLVTEASVDNTHGTGVQLIRIFQNYRRGKLLVVLPEGSSAGPFDRVFAMPAFQKNLAGKIGLRVWNRLAPAIIARTVQWAPGFALRSLEPSVNRFNPDLVLGVVYTNDGLRLMNAVLRALRGTPSVLWFYDLQLTKDCSGCFRDFNKILKNLTEIWTFSPLMLERLRGSVDRWPTHVRGRVQSHWCMPITDKYRRTHNSFSKAFKCIVLGNIWDSRMISVIKRLWRECQHQIPGLSALQWLCHESGVRRVLGHGVELGPEIEWQGEVAESRLQDSLLNADLAIVPFAIKADSDYARFSVPSKMGEFAAIGVPMVILAGSQTATARYVVEFGVGELLTESGKDSWSTRVCEIIQSTGERARLSALARQYAVHHLDQNKVRRELFEELRRVALGKGSIIGPSIETDAPSSSGNRGLE